MNIDTFAKRFISHEAKCSRAFHVMLAYEDYLAGRTAMDSCQRLFPEFDNELDFHVSVWRFDALEGTAMFGEAIRDAVEADAIIVATYQRELPKGVRRWIDAWIPQKRGQKAALITFLQSDYASSAWHYLEEAAARAGLDFFATALNHREIRIPPSGGPVLEAWGINE